MQEVIVQVVGGVVHVKEVPKGIRVVVMDYDDGSNIFENTPGFSGPFTLHGKNYFKDVDGDIASVETYVHQED